MQFIIVAEKFKTAIIMGEFFLAKSEICLLLPAFFLFSKKLILIENGSIYKHKGK